LHERKYEWLYAYSYVKPATGDNFWVLMPEARTDLMTRTLQEFARYHNPKQNKIIVLLIDRAGWHMSSDLEVPESIRLFPLPPYTPQLQPVECIIPLLKESVANRSFKDMDTLEDTVAERCKWLMENTETVKGAVGFDWIIDIDPGTD
jgi:transposase